MMKVLITGFEPFGEIQINPSQVLVDEIAQQSKQDISLNLEAVILPVTFGKAVSRMQQLIQDQTPDIVLSFGVASRCEILHLERVAINLKDSIYPDNDGKILEGEFIIPDAPLVYFSNLPITPMRDFLERVNVPAKISNHAGTFVCNSVFYSAAHEIESTDLDTWYGFIHIPLIGKHKNVENPLSMGVLVDGLLDLMLWLVRRKSENEII